MMCVNLSENLLESSGALAEWKHNQYIIQMQHPVIGYLKKPQTQ